MLDFMRTGSLRASVVLLAALIMAMMPSAGFSPAAAQDALACQPIPKATPTGTLTRDVETPEFEVPEDAVPVTVGYTPISIFAPMFVAYEKGYFAEQGLDVTLEALPGGTDMVVHVATGNFDAGIGGIGPAYWNAEAQGLPVTVIAPGHMEEAPVASPLMISTEACESGEIMQVSDLEGKKVAVNAPGATEIWLDAALRTGGLTIEDIDLQYMPFPDAVAALDSGAIAASIVGEPLATQAENEGIAVRLASDFDVADYQVTAIFANDEFLAEHPEAATGLVTAYLKASRDLTEDFSDLLHLAIIEEYTGVPASLVAESVKPVYELDGEIDLESLADVQEFFRNRGLLEYEESIDPASMVDQTFVDRAIENIGENQADS
ncbi:MAG TPA: ABC transporter substrate-binding protein [Thermomicrobiales bacterium]|nr:ABC transporter substrate-binding protein [Thermomicrobiales bacterium]